MLEKCVVEKYWKIVLSCSREVLQTIATQKWSGVLYRNFGAVCCGEVFVEKCWEVFWSSSKNIKGFSGCNDEVLYNSVQQIMFTQISTCAFGLDLGFASPADLSFVLLSSMVYVSIIVVSFDCCWCYYYDSYVSARCHLGLAWICIILVLPCCPSCTPLCC